MKNLIYILITFFVFISCNAQQKITAKKDKNGYLVGIANKASLTNDSIFNRWFKMRYKEYETDPLMIAKLSLEINKYEIKGFMGTWCGDSKREVPRFYKILEETGFDENKIELICVDRTKTTPDSLQKGFNLIRVPTFIFYKDGKEVGRFVEYPRETMEADILKIVTQQPYKHSYDKTK